MNKKIIFLLFFLLVLSADLYAEPRVEEIRKAIRDNLYTQVDENILEALNADNLNQSLKALDPYARYISAEEYKAMISSQSRLTGVGVELFLDGDKIFVSPYMKGPLADQGITGRCLLLQVADQSVQGLGLNEVSEMLDGPPGSEVNLVLMPLSGKDKVEVKVVRKQYRPVYVELLPSGEHSVLRIRKFVSGETRAFLKAGIDHLGVNNNPILIDLRDAQGGDLYEALDCAAMFVSAGKPIGGLETRKSGETIINSPSGEKIPGHPVIFIGPDTASAAEAFASALKYYGLATLVGLPTYGKCSTQTRVFLSDDSVLQLTNGRILTPAGLACDEGGINPDIQVAEQKLFQNDYLIQKAKTESSGAFMLQKLDHEGRLTVRALMAWGAMPERFRNLLFEMRDKNVELLNADAAEILSWLRNDNAEHYFSDEERMLLRELATFMVGRNYLDQVRSKEFPENQLKELPKKHTIEEKDEFPGKGLIEEEQTLAGRVFELVSDSTVIVEVYDGQERPIGQGSGVIVDNRVVATNCHTVEKAQDIEVFHKQTSYPAHILHSDWERDLCSLKVEELDAPAVAIGSTEMLKVGSHVFAVGAPMGLELTLSDGIVSGLREISNEVYIQTTAPISPGSSGGGLYDREGKLVGLTTFLLRDSQNLNFAIPVEWIADLPERHTEYGVYGIRHNEWMEKAIEHENREDWTGLIDHSLLWIRNDPGNAMAWFCLGVGFMETRQWRRATEAFIRSTRIEPENSFVWYNMGNSFSRAGYLQDAVDAYEQALLIDPENELAWCFMALALMDMNKLSKAAKALGKALELDPLCPYSWYNLGIVHYVMRNEEKVVEVYQRLRSIDSELASKFFNDFILP